MVFDFHTHAFPDPIAAKTLQKLGAAAGIPYYTDGTLAGLAASMHAAGIGRSLVLPVATNPLKVGRLNEFAAEHNGENGIFFAGAMHPLCPDRKAELRRVRALGLRGIKIHPVYQGVNLDARPFVELLYEAADLGLFVVTHAGDDIGFPGETRCSPEIVARALRQAGEVTLILAHCGGWMNWERVPPLAEFKNVMIDTSFSLGSVRRTDGAPPLPLLEPAAFLGLVRAFGPDRVLFGTDSPWGGQQSAVRRIAALPFTAEEKEKILRRNAEALLAV